MLLLVAVLLALQGPVVSDTSPFRALPLPAPNRVRGASGAPGPDYWQQRADYVIRATLDTAGSLLRGTERIQDRKSTRLNSSHLVISYAVFCLKKKKKTNT